MEVFKTQSQNYKTQTFMWNIEKWKILDWYPNKMQQYHQRIPKCCDWCRTNFQMQLAP